MSSKLFQKCDLWRTTEVKVIHQGHHHNVLSHEQSYVHGNIFIKDLISSFLQMLLQTNTQAKTDLYLPIGGVSNIKLIRKRQLFYRSKLHKLSRVLS